jgi:filamentous hemagglutinin family protein
MRTSRLRFGLLATSAAAAIACGTARAQTPPPPPPAIPQLGTQVSGTVTVVADGLPSTLGTIPAGTGALQLTTATRSAVINWDSFNVGQGRVVEFRAGLPDAVAAQGLNYAVLNRVTGASRSDINGTIVTTGPGRGTIFVLNPNGILFGPTAVVNVGSLVAGAMAIDPANFTVATSGAVTATGLTASGSALIQVQEGARLTTPAGGALLLVAPQIDSAGALGDGTTGSVSLIAAATMNLSLNGSIITASVQAGTPVAAGLKLGGTVQAGSVYVAAIPAAGVTGALLQVGGVAAATNVTAFNGEIVLTAGAGVGPITAPAGSVTDLQVGSGTTLSATGTGRVAATRQVTLGGLGIATGGDLTVTGREVQVDARLAAGNAALAGSPAQALSVTATNGALGLGAAGSLTASGTVTVNGTGGNIALLGAVIGRLGTAVSLLADPLATPRLLSVGGTTIASAGTALFRSLAGDVTLTGATSARGVTVQATPGAAAASATATVTGAISATAGDYNVTGRAIVAGAAGVTQQATGNIAFSTAGAATPGTIQLASGLTLRSGSGGAANTTLTLNAGPAAIIGAGAKLAAGGLDAVGLEGRTGTVVLNGGAGISTGAIDALALTPLGGTPGASTLSSATLALGDVTTQTALRLAATGSLTASTLGSTTSLVSVSGLNGPVTIGAINAQTTANAETTAGGDVQVSSVRAGDAATISSAGNTTLGTGTAGSVTVRATNNATVGGAGAGGAITVSAGNDATLGTGTAGTAIAVTGGRDATVQTKATAAADILVGGGRDAFVQAATTPTDLRVAGARDATLVAGSGRTVWIDAGRLATAGGGAITASRDLVVSGGSVQLTGTASASDDAVLVSTTGAVAFGAGSRLTTTGGTDSDTGATPAPVARFDGSVLRDGSGNTVVAPRGSQIVVRAATDLSLTGASDASAAASAAAAGAIDAVAGTGIALGGLAGAQPGASLTAGEALSLQTVAGSIALGAGAALTANTDRAPSVRGDGLLLSAPLGAIDGAAATVTVNAHGAAGPLLPITAQPGATIRAGGGGIAIAALSAPTVTATAQAASGPVQPFPILIGTLRAAGPVALTAGGAIGIDQLTIFGAGILAPPPAPVTATARAIRISASAAESGGAFGTMTLTTRSGPLSDGSDVGDGAAAPCLAGDICLPGQYALNGDFVARAARDLIAGTIATLALQAADRFVIDIDTRRDLRLANGDADAGLLLTADRNAALVQTARAGDDVLIAARTGVADLRGAMVRAGLAPAKDAGDALIRAAGAAATTDPTTGAGVTGLSGGNLVVLAGGGIAAGQLGATAQPTRTALRAATDLRLVASGAVTLDLAAAGRDFLVRAIGGAIDATGAAGTDPLFAVFNVRAGRRVTLNADGAVGARDRDDGHRARRRPGKLRCHRRGDRPDGPRGLGGRNDRHAGARGRRSGADGQRRDVGSGRRRRQRADTRRSGRF